MKIMEFAEVTPPTTKETWGNDFSKNVPGVVIPVLFKEEQAWAHREMTKTRLTALTSAITNTFDTDTFREFFNYLTGAIDLDSNISWFKRWPPRSMDVPTHVLSLAHIDQAISFAHPIYSPRNFQTGLFTNYIYKIIKGIVPQTKVPILALRLNM